MGCRELSQHRVLWEKSWIISPGNPSWSLTEDIRGKPLPLPLKSHSLPSSVATWFWYRCTLHPHLFPVQILEKRTSWTLQQILNFVLYSLIFDILQKRQKRSFRKRRISYNQVKVRLNSLVSLKGRISQIQIVCE